MLNLKTFIKGIYCFVKSISKRAYRTCAIITSGIAIISVVALSAKDFGGSGKNAMVSNSVTSVSTDEDNDDDDNKQTEQIGQTEINKDDINQILSLASINSEYLSFISYEEKKQYLSTAQEETEKVETVDVLAEVEEDKEEQEKIELSLVENEVSSHQSSVPTTPAVGEQYTGEDGNIYIYNTIGIYITPENYESLLRIVEAEAGNQDDIGMMLVANVVINRVKSGNFSNTITGVVFQHSGNTYQFQPILNGTYYTVTVSEKVIQCVNQVLSGEDHSEGALYFARDTSPYSWFNTKLTFLFKHGAHNFYK